jgi:hypothetical protein
MAKPDTLIVDGHAFSWQQLEAWKAARRGAAGLI